MSTAVFKSIFPYNQELVAEYPLMDNSQLGKAIQNATDAYLHWREMSFGERAIVLKQVAAILRRDQEALATLITREMGKSYSGSEGRG